MRGTETAMQCSIDGESLPTSNTVERVRDHRCLPAITFEIDRRRTLYRLEEDVRDAALVVEPEAGRTGFLVCPSGNDALGVGGG
jgi:hypothetical protein